MFSPRNRLELCCSPRTTATADSKLPQTRGVYQWTLFMHPISEMSLNVLDSCIDEGNPKQFEDITAGEFLNERLVELGLIK